METDEDTIARVIRESRKEIGTQLDGDDLRLVTTVRHRNTEGGARASAWQGRFAFLRETPVRFARITTLVPVPAAGSCLVVT